MSPWAEAESPGPPPLVRPRSLVRLEAYEDTADGSAWVKSVPCVFVTEEEGTHYYTYVDPRPRRWCYFKQGQWIPFETQ